VTFYAEHALGYEASRGDLPEPGERAPGHAAVHYESESTGCDILVGRRALAPDRRVVVKVFDGLDTIVGDSVRDYLIRAAHRADAGGVDVAVGALGVVLGASEEDLVEQLGWYFGVDVDGWTPDLFAWFLKLLGGQELPPGVVRLPGRPARSVTFGPVVRPG